MDRPCERVSSPADWISPLPIDDCKKVIKEVSNVLSKRGPVARFLDSFVQSEKWREVIEFDIRKDIELSDFVAATQVRALVQKQDFLNLGYDPMMEGMKSFIKAEYQCRETNIRLELRGGFLLDRHLLWMTEKNLHRILGWCPSLSRLVPYFGPGASTSIKSAQASMSSKLSAALACSKECFPLAGQLLSETPHWAFHHSRPESGRTHPDHFLDLSQDRFETDVRIDSGKLTFVPKNAKTTRPIVVEPCLNGFWQLSVGSYLKGRLALYGIDLKDQERNRRLSRKGSMDGSLATVDLSSASDTLSWGLVSTLLPSDWLDLLASLRTGSVAYRGVAIEQEKFSSMGNGFTFELESAIFYSAALACVQYLGLEESDIGVFGDDIILPTEAYALFSEFLSFCGFTVNTEKSFWEGKFRESCGADWLDGNDVRPFFIKEQLSARSLFVMHNWFMRRCDREIAALIESFVHPSLRIYGPDGFGDGHLLGSHRLYFTRDCKRRGYGGGFFDTFQLRSKRKNIRKSGDWLIPTYSVYTRSGAEALTDPYAIRGFEGYKRTPIYTLTTGIFVG
jgi:hypothetical protein